MANPVVVNLMPSPGSVAKVGAPARFSVRSQTIEVLRDTIYLYRGSGPVFYEATSGLLPEEYEDLEFKLFALEGIQNEPAVRTIVGNELKIDKTVDPATFQEALYLMGGLQAPADPDSVLMVEFTLRVDWADITPDGNDTGVLVGLWARNSGVTVRFRGGTNPRAVELWDASYGATARPSVPGDIYRYVYDWDGVTDTYKLLWHPKAGMVRLFRSTGQGSTTPDELIIDGATADFITLPAEEQRVHQPWVYFGHAFGGAKSISYWSSVYLFNIAETTVHKGLFLGEQEGAVLTDDECTYEASVFPEDATRPWLPLPESFGTLGGSERLDNENVVLRREDPSESLGFYREETQLDGGVVTFDFTFRGELEWMQANTQNTGMEFYVDTGTVLARVALLYSDGISYLGIFTGGAPEVIDNYAADITSWQTERTFRLKVDPTGQASLSSLSATDEGVDEQYFVGVATSALPASSMPGPGLGFLNNANSSTARAALYVKRARYMTGLRSVDVAPVPAEWSSSGTGTESTEDGYITLESTDEASPYYFFYDEQRGDPENGNGAEFRVRVKSYSIGGEDAPIRAIPGVGVIVNDGTNHTALLFADAGPPTGKVIFLAKTDTDYAATLIKIRAGDASVAGTYTPVDWSIFHLYRLQRTVGGGLSLFIDNSAVPSLSVEERDFDYPISETGQWQIRFGNVVAGALVKSQWRLLRYNVSRGLDFSVTPKRSENEVLAKFGHAFNNIVELQDDANLEFSGTPGQFDTVPQDIEDFEEEWP